MADAIFVKDGYISRASTDINHGHPFVSFVFGSDCLRRGNRIQEQPRLANIDLLQCPFHAAHCAIVPQHKIEYRL